MDKEANYIPLIGLLTTVGLIAYTMGMFGGNSMPVAGKTVLLTGASEGMGLAAAKILATKGANLILVSRSVEKLDNALEQIKGVQRNRNQRFTYISADVSKENYAAAVIAEATTWNGGKPLDIVWCVAGTASPELFLDMEMKSMRRQMDINFFGTAEMSHAILKEWLAPDFPVEQTPRHLILTASAIIFFPLIGYSPYAPSKFALRSLADTLSQEVQLYPQNVKVHLVVPGTTLSPGFEIEERSKPKVTKQIEATDPRQTPEEVAYNAIKGLEKGNFMITVNWMGDLMRWGGLQGTIRNSWIVDSFMVMICAIIVWPIVHWEIFGQIRKYGKKNGHPATWKNKV